MKQSKAVSYEFKPIAFVRSPFATKFAVPRQPGLANSARGSIKLEPDPELTIALRGFEGFSHLWVVFVFHEHGADKWKPSIRPPRLGGNTRVGVLASRSPHRPNPIGISVLKIEKIDLAAAGGAEIFVTGLDLIEGTPILDIKPYLPYADSVPEASSGWASGEIPRHPVQFADGVLLQLTEADPLGERGLKALIVEVLELDPRPAFQQRKNPRTVSENWGRRYGFKIAEFDVQFELRESGFFVFELLPA